MSRETYTIQIGRCGIHSGHELWKQLCSEHKLNPEGKSYKNQKKFSNENKDIFFKETSNGKFLPRALLFDLEPRVLHNLNRSAYKSLYDKKNIIFSTQSAGNNWAKGYYQSIDYQVQLEENFRKNSEKCENLGIFNIIHSISGGTGAGAGSLVIEILRDEFPGKFINCYSIVPSQMEASETVVQPYNSILSYRWLTLYADCVTFFDNSSLEKIISSDTEIGNINFKHINFLISKIINSSTENIRFPINSNQSLESSLMSIIPMPNLHFISAGISNWAFFQKKKSTILTKIDSVKSFFDNNSVSCPFDEGKLISSIYFLNNSSNSLNFSNLLKKIHQEKKIKYTQWNPITINITNLNLVKKTKTTVPGDICLVNHTIVKNFFISTLNQYDVLRKRNAFLNNYLKNFSSGDGIELFADAKETVQSLVEEYEKAESSLFF
ncbi:gamma-tubulin (nucleomorph) [Chroomonas mesostigmatica CCMP1168]|uniref:Tubulin gamma chain n=1 Tax=Chroomonas mesostigmatica CCMP1168 TaxID=1195612 RepID=J7GAG3_9CRYP|nr:gamma-tubulin [Chroomonas mesostigmatica CCMP1168]|mmetsp:Transcript_7130/g.17733  ORF Transcript_7130/g.17733 Transcript_7130/m.17733 type:complete len:437 (+) Transcript_7130:75-1385(+)